MQKFYIEKQRPKEFLGKGIQKKCSKFTGEHSCPGVISIKLLSNIFFMQRYETTKHFKF